MTKGFKILGLIFLVSILGLSALLFYLYIESPDVSNLKKANPQTTRLVKQICGKKKCPLNWVSLDAVSPFLVKAIILAEDHRFFYHHGFDLRNLKRAMLANLSHGKIVWGGSTITNQLAKNLYLSSEKSFLRKLKEAIITYKLERDLSKKRILELYINVAQWGPDFFGVENAALKYFQKSAHNLTPFEAAFLASILPNPNLAFESGWQERFIGAGTKIFKRLISDYLPHYHGMESLSQCEDYLGDQDLFLLESLFIKLFNQHSISILDGKIQLFSIEQLLEGLSLSDQEFLKNLVMDRDQKSDLKCHIAQDVPSDLEATQVKINEWESKVVWVPTRFKNRVNTLLERAHAQNIPLVINSAYRSHGYQFYLFLYYLRQNKGCLSLTKKRVALPYQSEHACIDQLALDFADLSQSIFEQSRGFEWLKEHAPDFDLIMTYPENNTRSQRYEPWHWVFQ